MFKTEVVQFLFDVKYYWYYQENKK